MAGRFGKVRSEESAGKRARVDIRAGKRGQAFRYVEAKDAKHNEGAWALRFPEMLKFFFPAR